MKIFLRILLITFVTGITLPVYQHIKVHRVYQMYETDLVEHFISKKKSFQEVALAFLLSLDIFLAIHCYDG